MILINNNANITGSTLFLLTEPRLTQTSTEMCYERPSGDEQFCSSSSLTCYESKKNAKIYTS